MSEMTPEELAKLYHGPEAEIGPEARPKCSICRISVLPSQPLSSRGLCLECDFAARLERQNVEYERAQKVRQEHFYPEEDQVELEREHEREVQKQRELDAWHEKQQQRDHQRRMAHLQALGKFQDLAQPVEQLNASYFSQRRGFMIGLFVGAVAMGLIYSVGSWLSQERPEATE